MDDFDGTEDYNERNERDEAARRRAVREASANVHRCAQCQRDMGSEWLLGPVCGKCCRENHARVTGRKVGKGKR